MLKLSDSDSVVNTYSIGLTELLQHSQYWVFILELLSP